MSAISLNYACLFLNYKIVCFEVLCIIVLSNAFSYQTDLLDFSVLPGKKPEHLFSKQRCLFAIIKRLRNDPFAL